MFHTCFKHINIRIDCYSITTPWLKILFHFRIHIYRCMCIIIVLRGMRQHINIIDLCVLLLTSHLRVEHGSVHHAGGPGGKSVLLVGHCWGGQNTHTRHTRRPVAGLSCWLTRPTARTGTPCLLVGHRAVTDS